MRGGRRRGGGRVAPPRRHHARERKNGERIGAGGLGVRVRPACSCTCARMQPAQSRRPLISLVLCPPSMLEGSTMNWWGALLLSSFFLFFYSNSCNTIFNILFEWAQHPKKINPSLWRKLIQHFRLNVEIVYYICWNDQFKNVKIVLSPSQNNCNYRVQNLSHKSCNFDLPTTKHKTISERFLQKIITTSSTPHKRKMIFL